MTSPNGTRTSPMTGDEYLESIRDGREIWIYGERVRTSPRTRRSATPRG